MIAGWRASESSQLAPFESPSPNQIGQCCRATISASKWKPRLSTVLVWSVVNQPWVSGQRSAGRPIWQEIQGGNRARGGWRESQSTRAELCRKGWLCVLRAWFPGCCACVGASGSRQMLQMKEVLLCVDRGQNHPRWHLVGVWRESLKMMLDHCYVFDIWYLLSHQLVFLQISISSSTGSQLHVRKI